MKKVRNKNYFEGAINFENSLQTTNSTIPQ